jgi:Family of unknown function (DUF695)
MTNRRLALAMLASLPFGSADAATGLPEAGDKWLVLERASTRTPEIVTVVRVPPEASLRARFRFLLQITWGYRPLPNGMPAENELVQAREMYTALDCIVGSGGVYAMSRTGDGGRTMYYYVEAGSTYTEAIGKYFDMQPPISVKVTVSEEPSWDSVRKVLSAVK